LQPINIVWHKISRGEIVILGINWSYNTDVRVLAGPVFRMPFEVFWLHKIHCMKRIKKIVCLIVFIVSPVLALAKTNGSGSSAKFDWTPVMEAIIQVESEGNPNARSGNSCGAMQITPILVKECNQILERKKSNKRYSLKDRFSVAKSKEMFLLIQSFYNPLNNVEKAIRSWNGGPKFKKRQTQRYYERVISKIE
jgi:hypothetical protein